MKNISIMFLAAGIAIASLTTVAHAGSDRNKVPRVAYCEPDNDTVIDLSGKTFLTFRWKPQPLPAGGRVGYKFRLYKGFDYDLIVKEDPGRDVLSIDVPVEKFEDGATYSWHVEQRDASNMLWSLHKRWSFKVKKSK